MESPPPICRRAEAKNLEALGDGHWSFNGYSTGPFLKSRSLQLWATFAHLWAISGCIGYLAFQVCCGSDSHAAPDTQLPHFGKSTLGHLPCTNKMSHTCAAVYSFLGLESQTVVFQL